MIKSKHLNIDEPDVDECLDIIYAYIDNLCWESKFNIISEILLTVEIDKLTLDESLALLTTTYVIRNKVWLARAFFIISMYDHMVKEGTWDPEIFKGLFNWPEERYIAGDQIIDISRMYDYEHKQIPSQCSGGRTYKNDIQGKFQPWEDE